MAQSTAKPETSAVRDERMPRAARLAVLALVAALVGGALLLTAIRGPAMLIDLAGGVKAFFCM